MKKILSKIDENFEEFIMSIILWSIVLIMGLQVIMRYIFSSSLSWSEELSRYLYIWFSFLGMSHGVRNDFHIRLDSLEANLIKIEKPLKYFRDLVFIIFAMYMIKPGVNVIKFLIRSGQKSPALQIPIYFVYASLLIGLFLTLFRFFQIYKKIFFGYGDERQ